MSTTGGGGTTIWRRRGLSPSASWCRRKHLTICGAKDCGAHTYCPHMWQWSAVRHTCASASASVSNLNSHFGHSCSASAGTYDHADRVASTTFTPQRAACASRVGASLNVRWHAAHRGRAASRMRVASAFHFSTSAAVLSALGTGSDGGMAGSAVTGLPSVCWSARKRSVHLEMWYGKDAVESVRSPHKKHRTPHAAGGVSSSPPPRGLAARASKASSRRGQHDDMCFLAESREPKERLQPMQWNVLDCA